MSLESISLFIGDCHLLHSYNLEIGRILLGVWSWRRPKSHQDSLDVLSVVKMLLIEQRHSDRDYSSSNFPQSTQHNLVAPTAHVYNMPITSLQQIYIYETWKQPLSKDHVVPSAYLDPAQGIYGDV